MSTQQENEKIKIDIEEELISIDVATERKQGGNDFFRAGKWDEAIVAYQSALGCLPKRPKKLANSSESLDDGEEREGKGKAPEDGKATAEEKVEEEVVEVVTPAVDESQNEVRKLRAVLNANIGACYVKLGNHKEAVEVCTEALLDDPDYVKALERRAASNETLNTWSGLTSAQDDYNKLLSLASSPSQINDIQRKLHTLKPRLEAAQKRETDEMLSKLKGLGNSLLGNFGLSTDNFKFVPNGQGGYSVNFNQ